MCILCIQYFSRNKNSFHIFLKIEGEGLNNNKTIYLHLYSLDNSRKSVIFFGFTTYREKRQELEGTEIRLIRQIKSLFVLCL